jgi:hypothetical protein
MLQHIGDKLWAHEALIHEVVLRFIQIPLWHRMTVMRLDSGEVVLHSPTLLDTQLCAAIDALGPVGAVIAPSWWHDLHLKKTLSLYPRARLFVTPSLLRSHQNFTAHALGDKSPDVWSVQIEQTRIEGIALHFDEFVFYHRASRSLILADLLVNADAFASGLLQRFIKVASGTGCCFPRIFRAAVLDRKRFKASIQRVLEWDFDRIIIGHGDIVETGGKQVFCSAFRWIL